MPALILKLSSALCLQLLLHLTKSVVWKPQIWLPDYEWLKLEVMLEPTILKVLEQQGLREVIKQRSYLAFILS